MTAESQIRLDDEPPDATVAVVAHGLLNSMAIIARRGLDALTESHRRESDAGPAS